MKLLEKRVAGTSGRSVAGIDGVDGEAELRFTVRGPSLISADHTEAPASMRGSGPAPALVEHMIGDARSKTSETPSRSETTPTPGPSPPSRPAAE
jgi:uncharacterized protein